MNGDIQNSFLYVWYRVNYSFSYFCYTMGFYKVMTYPTALFLSYFKSCGSIYPLET